jgi:signal peptidase II
LPEQTDTVATAGKPRVSVRALVVLAVVAVCLYLLDLTSKNLVIANLVERSSVEVIGELLRFTFVKNPGAAFSLGTGTTWIFAILASIVAVVIIVFSRRIRSIAWAIVFGLLLGGTLGNLTDRLFREPGFGVGHVIDFIQIYGFPAIFNVADIAICSAMGLFIILTVRGIGLDGTRTARSKDGESVVESSAVTETETS